MAAVALLKIECTGLAYEVAQLAEAIGARIEVCEKLGDLLADGAERGPAVLAFDLRNRCFQNRHRRAWWLQYTRGTFPLNGTAENLYCKAHRWVSKAYCHQP